MPTYVYECRSCNATFEAEQRITEDPLRDCGCGAKGTLRRLIQPVGVVFNGAGFHINDYAKPNGAASKRESDGMTSAPDPAAPCTPEGCPRCAAD